MALPLALTGTFVELAALSVVARLATYIGTAAAVPILRRKLAALPGTVRLPGGPLIPIAAVLVCLVLVGSAERQEPDRRRGRHRRRPGDLPPPAARRARRTINAMSSQPVPLRDPASLPRPAPLEVSVLVPVLDEAETVEELARARGGRARPAGPQLRDRLRRRRLARRHRRAGARGPRARDPRVKLVRLRRNFGKAAALSRRLRPLAAAELVITMDGDLQDDPEEIPRLLATLEEQDLDLVSGWKRRRQRPGLEAAAVAPLQLGDAAARAGRRCTTSTAASRSTAARCWSRSRSTASSTATSRCWPAAAASRSARSRSRHHPRRHGVEQVRLGPLLQGAARPHHRALHHPLHAPAAPPLRRLRPALPRPPASPSTSTSRSSGSAARTCRTGRCCCFGVLLMLLGIQVLTTGLLGEMITFKNFRRRDSYSVKERLE